ncbi:electron transfer flavoprotein beta subunit/FixA family protein [Thermanaerosceptrum fracticalcis]|uniref:Electron transfer flavoprotein small subunit n=1 Tax=Thermanaerosceptrum fracticalcis TaxID=1712410 RepID=A0A7G6E3T6_THEFR|nr:hypothetical protein [Thermanaerosceptrum fracticalcis]QNB46740.1 electron transfer flavoprotein beta subunit/FixA family protein [Thermanaerosceptrum fracticalcis]
MPKIIACYKWVVDEADIKIEGRTRELVFDKTTYKINEYDRNAIEVGVQLVEEQGAEVTAITVGNSQVKNSLKDVLSRGPAQAVYVADDRLGNVDAGLISKCLSGLVKQIGEYDMIICGEGSSDWYNQQVGPRVAVLLGIPSITCVNKITLQGDKVIAERKLENGIEVVEAQLPVVITVLPDINKPRIPSLKQILGAAKKPTRSLTVEEVGIDMATEKEPFVIKSVLGTDMSRRQNKIEGDNPQVLAQKALEILRKEGLLG